MQGRKSSEPKLFYQVSLDRFVPQDHIIRKIHDVLDLSSLYTATKPYYAHDGKPSIDPIVLFKLYIIRYFFGIPSERRILKEVQVNLAYRWYLGYDLDEALPDHSILTKARQGPQVACRWCQARICPKNDKTILIPERP